jgi:hypothetical protein
LCNITASNNRRQCCTNAGGACREARECCGSMLCVSGRCQCQPRDGMCRNDTDCCGGRCDLLTQRCSA